MKTRAKYSSSGRYQYKFWSTDTSGERIAIPAWRSQNKSLPPDLINTAYLNRDGIRVVYGLAFDLDVHRAESRWIDCHGQLDWPRMRQELKKEHPDIAGYITHVVRSTGWKGLGLVVAINPLPIIPSTVRNQEVATNLHRRLINLFIEMGFGADPSAHGLERDFPNFKDPRRLVDRNEVMQRRIEQHDTPVVSLLHNYLNKVDAQKRTSSRIYPDARVEERLSRLVSWLLGVHSPDPSTGLRPAIFLGEERMSITLDGLRKLTGLSDKFLRKFLNNPPEWLSSRRVVRGEWQLCIPFSKHIKALLERIDTFGLKRPDGTKKLSFHPGDLILPEYVMDGERNRWITLMALSYKWAGYAASTALYKIAVRTKSIPGYESSRNCRQVGSIVKNIYKNMPETFASLGYKDLPLWMKDDGLYEKSETVVSDRRGVAPSAGFAPEALGLFFSNNLSTCTNHSNVVDAISREYPSICLTPSNENTTCYPGGATPVDTKTQLSLVDSSLVDSPPQRIKRLVAIRRGHRVGIFDGENILICCKKDTYKASQILEYLAKNNPECSGYLLKIYTPHRIKQKAYYPAIDTHDYAGIYCERKKRCLQKLAEWEEKKGYPYSNIVRPLPIHDPGLHERETDFEIPF